MSCKACQSANQRLYASEINIHVSEIIDVDLPGLFIFPQLLVCLDCGFTEFSISAVNLQQINDELLRRRAA